MKKLVLLMLMGILVVGIGVVVYGVQTDSQTVGSTVDHAAESITAPQDDTVSAVRLADGEYQTPTVPLVYVTDYTDRDITVVAAAADANWVTGAKLYIKGGSVVVDTLLITGNTPEAAVTLQSDITASDTGALTNAVQLKLDATDVAAAPANGTIGTSFDYTLTYTLTAL